MSKSSRCKLFCIPHAAGSASLFHHWKELVPASVDLIPLELAGRGKRFAEALYPSFDDALEDLRALMLRYPLDQPYALFGHSMGSLLAYELAWQLQNMGVRPPEALFLAGQLPPNRFPVHHGLHRLPDNELWDLLLELGNGAWDRNDAEIRDVYLPIFRGDLRVCETYRFRPGRDKLTCRLVIMNGEQDAWVGEELGEWRQLSEKACEFKFFRGGHYFIYEEERQVIDQILQNLKKEG
ncbi:thioesterase [Paenibacillus dendritiformis]|uniref:thioesterase II family protein n=1 Tax=Paenibacillus dendritiformis TaxID=130049 RepID=UPI001B0A565D|nr:alpha/beta fold hydrolase [Paenibacillus dendritiformis]GIO74016.1 thioesterase [Paenibacillus dendritiformis]